MGRSGLSNGHPMLTQQTGGKDPLVTAVTTDSVTAGRKTVGIPTENGWGTVSVRDERQHGKEEGRKVFRDPSLLLLTFLILRKLC